MSNELDKSLQEREARPSGIQIIYEDKPALYAALSNNAIGVIADEPLNHPGTNVHILKGFVPNPMPKPF